MNWSNSTSKISLTSWYLSSNSIVLSFIQQWKGASSAWSCFWSKITRYCHLEWFSPLHDTRDSGAEITQHPLQTRSCTPVDDSTPIYNAMDRLLLSRTIMVWRRSRARFRWMVDFINSWIRWRCLSIRSGSLLLGTNLIDQFRGYTYGICGQIIQIGRNPFEIIKKSSGISWNEYGDYLGTFDIGPSEEIR